MIALLALTSFLYALLTLWKKTTMLVLFNAQTWMLINSGLMFAILCVIALLRPKDYFDKNTMDALQNNIGSIMIYRCIGISTTFAWIYLLKTSKMSNLMPLNMVFVTLFSTMLGVGVLGEKLTNKQMVGIAMAITSIYLIHT